MNKEEFTNEILRAEKGMYCIAKSILHSDEDCADAIQNAILKAWQHRSSLKEQRYFKTWITRILINECYAMIRSRKETVSYEDYVDSSSGEFYSSDTTEESPVFSAVQDLPEEYRMPIVLHYMNGFSISETAGMLRLSEGAVKMRLSRAKAVLRSTIGDFE